MAVAPSRKRRVFRRIFTYFILTLFFPVLISLVTFLVNRRLVEQNLEELNQDLANQISVGLEGEVRQLHYFSGLVTSLQDSRSNNYINLIPARDLSTVDTVNGMIDWLANEFSKNPYFRDIMFYSAGPDLLVSPVASYLPIKNMKTPEFFWGPRDFEAFRTDLRTQLYFGDFQTALQVNTGDGPQMVVPFFQSVLPRSGADTPRGQLVLLVSPDLFLDPLQAVLRRPENWVFLSKEGETRPLLSQNIDPGTAGDIMQETRESPWDRIVEEQRYMVFSGAVGDTGLSLTIGIERSQHFLYLRRMLLIFVLSLFVISVAGISLAYFFSSKYSRPIASVVSEIQDNLAYQFTEESTAMEFIDQGLHRLLSDRHDLESQILHGFMKQLVMGEHVSDRQWHALLENPRLAVYKDAAHFTVLYLQYQTSVPHETETRVEVYEAVTRFLTVSGFVLFFDTKRDSFAVVLAGPQQELEKFKGFAESAARDLEMTLAGVHGTWVKMAMGEPVRSISRVSLALLEAEQTLFRGDFETGNLVWYARASIDEGSYYFPFDVEYRLQRLIFAGHTEGVAETVAYLYEENFQKRKISYTIQIQFHQDVLRFLEKTRSALASRIKNKAPWDQLNDLFYAVSATDEPRRFFDEVRTIAQKMAESVHSSETRASSALAAKIDRLIHEQYANQALSLSYLSTELNLSENYISHMYKEKTGRNLNQAILRHRMERAAQQLLETKKGVALIGAEVGYPAESSFRQAFKRYFLTSPSDYRKRSSQQ